MKRRQCYVSSMKQVPIDDQPNRMKWVLVEDREFVWTFHQWGTDYVEFETGGAEFTCAIIEAECGKVAMVRADWIRFIDVEDVE